MAIVLRVLLCVAIVLPLSVAEVILPFTRRTAQQQRTIKVRCKVTGENFAAWETPSREPRPGHPASQGVNITLESEPGRVRVRNDTDYYTLVIEDVGVGDGGNYTCKGSNQSKSFTLEVDFVSRGVKSPQQLRYGENGTIQLDITAFPPPKYFWYRNGRPVSLRAERKSIDPYTGTMAITNVSTTDAGNYSCTVRWKMNSEHETEDTVDIEVFVVPVSYTTATAVPQPGSSIAPSMVTSVKATTETENSVSPVLVTTTFNQSSKAQISTYDELVSASETGKPMIPSRSEATVDSSSVTGYTSKSPVFPSTVYSSGGLQRPSSGHMSESSFSSVSTNASILVSASETGKPMTPSRSEATVDSSSVTGYTSKSPVFPSTVYSSGGLQPSANQSDISTAASSQTLHAIVSSGQLAFNHTNVTASTSGLSPTAEVPHTSLPVRLVTTFIDILSTNATVTTPVTTAVGIRSSVTAYIGESFTIPTAVLASSMSMVSAVGSVSQLSSSLSFMVSHNGTSPSSLSGALASSTTTTSPSLNIVQSSRVSSSNTSAAEGFIVTSYTTPCYIYYVVEKTVLPATSANHSIAAASTPKLTLDIGSITDVFSRLPSVTLTHTVAMTTLATEARSPVSVTSDVPGSFTESRSVSPRSSMEETPDVSQTQVFPPKITTEAVTSDMLVNTVTSVWPSHVPLSSQVQLDSSQQQTGRLVSHTVAVSASESLNTSTISVTPKNSPMPSSFSVVSTPSVSGTHDLTTATSTKPRNVGASHLESSIGSSSLFQTRKSIATSTSPIPFQSLGSVTLQSVTLGSVVSRLVLYSNTMETESIEESVLSSGSVLLTSTPKTGILTGVSSLTTVIEPSVGSQALTAITSSPLSRQSQNSIAITSSGSGVSKTSALALVLSVTIETPSSRISSSLFTATGKLVVFSSATTNNTALKESTMEASKSSSFNSEVNTPSMVISSSPNAASSMLGHFSTATTNNTALKESTVEASKSSSFSSEVNTPSMVIPSPPNSASSMVGHFSSVSSLPVFTTSQKPALSSLSPPSSGPPELTNASVSTFGQSPSESLSNSASVTQELSSTETSTTEPLPPYSETHQRLISNSLPVSLSSSSYATGLPSPIDSVRSLSVPVSPSTAPAKRRRKRAAEGSSVSGTLLEASHPSMTEWGESSSHVSSAEVTETPVSQSSFSLGYSESLSVSTISRSTSMATTLQQKGVVTSMATSSSHSANFNSTLLVSTQSTAVALTQTVLSGNHSSSPFEQRMTTITTEIPPSVVTSGTMTLIAGISQSNMVNRNSTESSNEIAFLASSQFVRTNGVLSTSNQLLPSFVPPRLSSMSSYHTSFGVNRSSLSSQKERSAGVSTSSLFNTSVSVPAVSSRDSITLSTVFSSPLIVQSTISESSMTMMTSPVVVNTLSSLSTSSILSASSSFVFTNSSFGMSSKQTSSTVMIVSPTAATNEMSFSSVVLKPSVPLQSSTLTQTTDLKLSNVSVSTSPFQTSITESSTIPTAALYASSMSVVSIVASVSHISSSPPGSSFVNTSSTFRKASSAPATLQDSILPTSKRLSTTYDNSNPTTTVSNSSLMQPLSSAIQSSVRHVSSSSSVNSSPSSFVYRPPLMTMSSLGICYVVYTTRLVQPSSTPTPQVTVSFTRAVNVSSTQILPSDSSTSSSVVLQSPTSSMSISSTRSVSVIFSSMQSSVADPTSPPSFSTISLAVNSTISTSTASRGIPSTRMPLSSFSASVPSPLSAFSSEIAETVSVSFTEVFSSSQAPTSQVSPTRTLSPAMSSSVVLPTTRPPDSFLLQTTVTVPQETDILSEKFKGELEKNLADAYKLAEVSFKRRRRSVGVTTTVQSIERLANGRDVNVTFYVTKNGQLVPADQATQNYNKLNKGQFSTLLELDVVSMPQPLIQPSAPSRNYLVSVIIQNSAGDNISLPANKQRLEADLASYYKDKREVPESTSVTATIYTIVHEPNERAYLEFVITVGGEKINGSVVVETFKVSNVNLLTAQLGVQVLVPVYIPDSLTASESDHVVIGISIVESQDLQDASFRTVLANKLTLLYEEARGRRSTRRKRRSGSTSVTIVDIVRRNKTDASEADVTFFVFDSGAVANGSYVTSVLNRLSTGQMTTFTTPYAVLTAPKVAVAPTMSTIGTQVVSTVAATPIMWWIIPAVIGPILLIIVIILLVCWRWKKGAPKAKVVPDTIQMLETNRTRNPPVHGFDVSRHTEPEVSGKSMKTTTSFMSRRDDEEETEKPTKRGRETSLRRKVGKPPIQSPPTTESLRRSNPVYEEEEEEVTESEESVTPTGSAEVLIRSRSTPRPLSAAKRPPAPPQRTQEPPVRQELSEDEVEEESEVSGELSETEAESVAPPAQLKHSAAQLPTVAVMSEASGPPRYPPVRFRSSVHPAPSLPPLDSKKTSLVGVRVEPPSDNEGRRKKGQVTKRELDQKSDLERQKNKQRLRDRKHDSARLTAHDNRTAWDKAQHDFDDVLAEDETAQRVIIGKKVRRRKRRPQSSSLATDEEGMPQLKSYRKLRSPKTISSATSSRDHGKKPEKSTESVSNTSSEESDIDMNETRRRMHAMLDDAFALFGPQSAKKASMQLTGQPPQPEGYPGPPVRPAVIPRYVGGHPALPEPPPAHGRATEPTPRQRRRIQPTIPGYPTSMPQTPIGVPGYPGRPPVRPVVTRDPLVVWDPADRQRILDQRTPPATYAYRDPSGQNVYITPVHQQRDDMGGLVWSPYATEDTMDALYPDLAQASYPGALGTTPPKDASFLSQLQAAEPHDTVLNMSANGNLDQRKAALGQSPQPLIKSIKDELFRLSQGTTRKTPITEL
ncbi:streptococcal hemagglutinin-like isoform X3 [Montipora capricornis]|uniref:streptococcal hemagglutinin-like isoform X3 n=1 Tax=Montipora capricornis TaxID=246305 RepID=UPI0035F18B36